MSGQRSSILGKLKGLPAVLARELLLWIEWLLRDWPGESGYRIRWLYYRCRFKHLGRKVLISPGVRFVGHRCISIGAGSHIDIECMISAGPAALARHEVRRIANSSFEGCEGEVRIGEAVHIAPRCLIIGHGGVQIGDCSGCTSGTAILSLTNHYASFGDRSRRDLLFTTRAEPRSYIVGPVVLGRNVGVALNCVVLPGTTLSDESFLAIGSVARGTIPPNSIAAGNPAVRVRDRFAAPSSCPGQDEQP